MNDTLKTIHSLRSIHGNFSSKEMKDEDLDIILNACVRAANASNRQSYSIIVIKDKKVMRKLCSYCGSKVLIFCRLSINFKEVTPMFISSSKI